MKIPRSVRDLYAELTPAYAALKERVDVLITSRKESRWHYESRLKSAESFALKLETGRCADPSMVEDFFACTLVVENHARVHIAEELVCNLFRLDERRPKQSALTHLAPSNFDFDDLRLYVRWKDDPAVPRKGIEGRVFEVQVKTFLQHAWSIATHDLVYKTDDVDWATSRIAFQVKGMLENAELSIAEAQQLTDASLLKKSDRDCEQLRKTIAEIKTRWQQEQLPKDLRRLAQNVVELTRVLRIGFADLWAALDEASAAGEGASTLNLSPYGAVVAALLRKQGARVLEPLGKADAHRRLFVPSEIEMPEVPDSVKEHLIRVR